MSMSGSGLAHAASRCYQRKRYRDHTASQPGCVVHNVSPTLKMFDRTHTEGYSILLRHLLQYFAATRS